MNPRARELAEAVRSRVPWLAGVHARRMVPPLLKFALAGWSATDVSMALQDVIAARGRGMPAELRSPAGYMATLLRDVDPAAQPTVMEAQVERFEREAREYERLRVYGRPCSHGMPAGNVTSPNGYVACPFCRGADVELAEVLSVAQPRRDPAAGRSGTN